MDKSLKLEKFSNMLEEKREFLGFSKIEMADFLGVSYLQLQRWVSKKTLPRSDTLRACCKKLGIDHLKLFSITVSGNPILSLDVDHLVDRYRHTSDLVLRKKSFLFSCSLVFNAIHNVYGSEVHMFLGCCSPALEKLCLFDLTVSITSNKFGHMVIIPTPYTISFKHSEGNSQDNSGDYLLGFETLSMDAINRILELLQIKFEINE